MTEAQCLKITQNVACEFSNLGIVCLIKIDPSGNTVTASFRILKKNRQIDHFCELLSPKNENVGCFARNVE